MRRPGATRRGPHLAAGRFAESSCGTHLLVGERRGRGGRVSRRGRAGLAAPVPLAVACLDRRLDLRDCRLRLLDHRRGRGARRASRRPARWPVSRPGSQSSSRPRAPAQGPRPREPRACAASPPPRCRTRSRPAPPPPGSTEQACPRLQASSAPRQGATPMTRRPPARPKPKRLARAPGERPRRRSPPARTPAERPRRQVPQPLRGRRHCASTGREAPTRFERPRSR